MVPVSVSCCLEMWGGFCKMNIYWKTLKCKIPHIFQSEYQNRLYKLPKNNSVITLFGTFGSVIENYFPLSSLTTWSILNPTLIWRCMCPISSLWAFYKQYPRIDPGQNMLPPDRGRGGQWQRYCEEEYLDSRHLLCLLHVQPLLHEEVEQLFGGPVSKHEALLHWEVCQECYKGGVRKIKMEI